MSSKFLLLISILFILKITTATFSADIYEVTTNNLRVRTLPTQNSARKGNLKKGAKVEVFESVGEIETIGSKTGRWVKIKGPILEGYVFGPHLKEILNQDICQRLGRKFLPKVEELTLKYPNNARNRVIIIDESEQKLFVYKNNVFITCYIVTTSLKKMSNVSNSDGTPTGAHYIKTKIGEGAKKLTVFVGRKPEPKIKVTPTDPPIKARDGKKAHVTTRLLWLAGLEEDNENTYDRYVYIHGTNKEHRLGTKNSKGCIRMRNDAVINLFENTPKNSLVYLQK